LLDAAITVGVVVFLMRRYAATIDPTAFILQTNYSQLGVLVCVPVIVHAIAASMLNATPGMYLMDVQLIQDNGENIEFSNVLRRPLGALVMLLTLGLAAFVPFLNDRRRTVGDWLSGTRVIEEVAPGRRISFSAWRIFRSTLRYLGPISAAGAIALLLASKSEGPNKAILLDAVLIAATVTLLAATLIAAVKVRLSRVRLSPRGIQRSGWLGWKRKLVAWADLDYARIRPGRLFSYFEVHRHDRRHFRIPVEHDTAQLTASTLVTNGVRIEP
jgi:uncharacterized RDD family membrane protein YckC